MSHGYIFDEQGEDSYRTFYFGLPGTTGALADSIAAGVRLLPGVDTVSVRLLAFE